MDPDKFVDALVKAARKSDRKVHQYIRRHNIPITFSFAAVMTAQSEDAGAKGDLRRLTALLRVRTILMSELASAPEVIGPSLRWLWTEYVRAGDASGLDWIGAQSREIVPVARHVGDHESAFSAAILAANCAYFIAEGPPKPDTVTRGRWLLAALVDAATAAQQYDASGGSAQFHQYLSLLESLVDRSEVQIWLEPNDERRARESLQNLAVFVDNHVPVDYEFPAEEAARMGVGAAVRSHRIALALAKLSVVHPDRDSAVANAARRLQAAMRWADTDGNLNRWLDAARLLHDLQAGATAGRDDRGALRQEIRQRAEAIRGQYRSRLGRLWAAYRQESIIGHLLRDELSEPDIACDEVFRAVEAIKARTVLDDLAGLHVPIPEEVAHEISQLEQSLVTFEDSPQRGVVVEELRYASSLPLTLATNRGSDVRDSLRRLEDLHERHGIGFTGTAPVIPLAEVQAALEPGEFLVEFIVLADLPEPVRQVWLLAITREAAELVACPTDGLPDDWIARQLQVDGQQPIDGGPLLSPIVDLRRAIRVGDDDEAEQLLRLLHSVLIAPLLAGGRKWENVRRLITVPHGPLHMLPWAALTDANGHRLAEHVQLVTAPSAAVWLALARRATGSGRGALAVGAPSLPDRPALKYAPLEIKEIASAMPGMKTTLLTGPDATETAFRSLASGQGIIHLATHGKFPEQNPLRFHQLELSADATTDGIIEAETLRQLDLRSAWLVVLNVCDGGLYRFGPGDEPYGIVPALLSAGASAVLAPIWRIDDRRAATFMADFYHPLLNTGPAESLRRAMVARSRDFPLRDWCGYTLVGTGRPPSETALQGESA